ncbi:MAG TPA: cobalamin-dependent protein [Ktedonobacterales bacterium]
MLVHEPRAQAPQLEAYSDLPLFNTKAVVHQTGVPAPTLRAWERRYGILAPRRGENDYRLYSERDMAIISWLHERIASGLTISQAIALLRSLEASRRRGRRTATHANAAHTHGIAPTMREEPQPASDLTPVALASELLTHCALLDEAGAASALAQAFAAYPLEEVCARILTPTLNQLGQQWRDGDIPSAVEHFASALVRAKLEGLFHSSPTNEGAPLALVGCAPGELHELGALMLALFLRRAGLHVIYLGQSLEPESLSATIQSCHPRCLLLSATLRPQAEALGEVARRLEALGPCAPSFYVGGQAFADDPDLAPRIRGDYLGLDAPSAALEIKRRLTA